MSAEAPIMELEREAPEILDERFVLDDIGLKWATWRKGHFPDHPEYGKPIIGQKGKETLGERLVATRNKEDPAILIACQDCSPGTQNEPLYRPLPPEIRKQIKGLSYSFCRPHLEKFLAPVRARRAKEEAERQELEQQDITYLTGYY